MATLKRLYQSVMQARWSVISTVSPFAGFAAAAVIGSIWARLPNSTAVDPVLYGSIAFGFLAGVIALSRPVEPPELAWLAVHLNVNAALAICLVLHLS